MIMNEHTLILPTCPYGSAFQRLLLKAEEGYFNDRQAKYSIA